MRADEPRITALQSRIHSDLVARVDRHDAAGQVLVVAAGEVGRFHHPLPRVLRRMLASAPSDRASGLKSLPQEQPSAAIGLQPIVRSYDSRFPIPDSRRSVADAAPAPSDRASGLKSLPQRRHRARDQSAPIACSYDSRIPIPESRLSVADAAPAPSDRASGLKSLPQEQPSAAIGLQPIVHSCDSPIPTPESQLSVADACAGTAGTRVGTEVPPTRPTQRRDQSATDRPLLRFPNPDSQFPASQIL